MAKKSTIDLLTENLKNREIFFLTGVDEESSEPFIRQIRYLCGKSKRKIKIYMDSPGGEEGPGMAMYNAIMSVRRQGIIVEIEVLGECCSMAPVILQAATKRIAHKNTLFMVHESSYPRLRRKKKRKEDDREVSYETVAALEDWTVSIRMIEDWLTGVMSARSRLDAAQWKRIMKKKDHYFLADKALEYGFIDKIVE